MKKLSRSGAIDDSVIGSAWHDEDDDFLEINLDSADRLKKLKNFVDSGSGKVSGADLSSVLQERCVV